MIVLVQADEERLDQLITDLEGKVRYLLFRASVPRQISLDPKCSLEDDWKGFVVVRGKVP